MKNNNPCNLRYVPLWRKYGGKPGYNDFAAFETAEQGMRACLDQIAIDAKRGHTLESFIHKFAPPFENDTALYIRQVADMLGVKTTARLTEVHHGKLARAMVKKESSTIITN